MMRGDIYLVDFEPSVGAEIRKVRPALIISCNEANRHLKTIMVIPFTSNVARIYPFEVLVSKSQSGLEQDSKLKIPQMRAIDRSRLKKYVGALPEETMVPVEKAIKLHLSIE
jgi:mRNA interferase MazF